MIIPAGTAPVMGRPTTRADWARFVAAIRKDGGKWWTRSVRVQNGRGERARLVHVCTWTGRERPDFHFCWLVGRRKSEGVVALRYYTVDGVTVYAE